MFLMNNLFLFFQSGTSEAPTTNDVTTTIAENVEQESLLDIILTGSVSGVLVMIILLIMSFIAIYIIIERYLTIKKLVQLMKTS